MPAKYLPGKVAKLDFASAHLDGEHEDGSPRISFPEQEGTAIWCLPGNATRGMMMRAQQLNGTRVLVEVDDNYLTLPPHGTEWQKELDRTDEDAHSREAHVRIVKNVADGVIVSTPYLAKRYERTTDKPVYLCRNCVDPKDWEGIDKFDDGILRFGWSASASHRFDAPLLKRAIDYLVKQDGVKFVFIGLQPAEYWGLDEGAVERVQWTDDLFEYRRVLSYLDVGFAPVKRTDWSAARSDLKALEYSMAGAVTICSDNEPYDLWQKDMPCLTAHDSTDFYKMAQWCVSHRDELKTIAKQAKEYVLAERCIEENVWRWQEAISS